MGVLAIEKTEVLSPLLGDNPYTKVIEFFLANRNSEFTVTEIAENSEISRTTLWIKIIDNLLNDGIITKTREILERHTIA